jgi:Na+-translocating ferredoxin:NAD+ oxidoreductase subunit B
VGLFLTWSAKNDPTYRRFHAKSQRAEKVGFQILRLLPGYNGVMNTQPDSPFDANSPYRRLAHSLDSLPNRFPPADDESDLRLLAKIFTPEEADLTADLLPEMESPAQISERTGRDLRAMSAVLKELSKKGVILVGKTAQGRLGFALMPFVVGIYEAQAGKMDAEMAQLFETYYRRAFGSALKLHPQVHRVIPVGVSIQNNMEIHPFESVTGLVGHAQSWGVLDCICRTQKALVGEPCGHPLDVCMVLSEKADAFSTSSVVHALTQGEALQTLQRAAEAGLVHCVSNNQQDLWYICNCCTCSCSILRGMADLGLANVVARSAFVNTVNEEVCIGCGECLPACAFNALTLTDSAKASMSVQVQEVRCVGCGVCVLKCPQDALGLKRREGEAIPPLSADDWRAARMRSQIG